MKVILPMILVFLVGCGTEKTISSEQSSKQNPPEEITFPESEGKEWRVVAEVSDASNHYDFYSQLAKNKQEFETLLQEVNFTGSAPSVVFEEDFILAFAIWHGSGCKAPFENLLIDHSSGTITPEYDSSEVPDGCPSDTVGYATFLAVDKSTLSAERYSVEDRSSDFPGITFKTEEVTG